ncbi:hypothetical protein HPB52_021080 [Rhipicephalus sanguineus]|uniref:ABC transporter domain-containing protein n=1 Tax=Rhipicephalus sanguineus TaxID=34632 RepID=A0A9D4PIK0_RHISA|nr:hypothetical protein HPB52_021080 [Rhipicephalus sanguineus]
MRRHGISTLMEMVIIAGFFYALTYVQEKPEPLSKDSDEKDASSALTAPSKVTDIVYAPKSDYNEKLMDAVADEIFRLVTSQVMGLVECFIAILMMTLVKYQGSTFAHGLDASLITVSFIMFQIGFSMLPILLTWVFPKAGADDPGRLTRRPSSYWNPEVNASTAGEVKTNKDPARFEELPPDSKVIIDINGLTKSGTATVCGYDVSAQRQKVREKVSFCQQTDIFFDDMTCFENVLYFGSLKGARRSRLYQSATDTLRLVGIGDKAYSMPKELSGGMKRRLSMAMTLVSEPDLLILDEPTAGMDPETRRIVWDVLQKVAKQRTLLLSSHDMEEADAIADQIVIMAAGSVVCTGSTTFLKKACDVMGVVQKTIPHAVVDDDKHEEVCIALGTMENKQFPGMFKTLESSMGRLGISSIGVSVASMKDVYLKINMDWAPGGKGREDPVDGMFRTIPLKAQHIAKDIEAVSRPINKHRTMARSFGALFYKRLLSLVRSWDLYLFFFLGPLAILAMGTWLAPQQSLLKTFEKQKETLDVPIGLSTQFPDSTVVLGEAPATNVSNALRVLIESQGCTVRTTKDVKKELSDIMEDDFAGYIMTYPMAVAFQSSTVQGWLYWVILAALTYTMSFAAYASFPVDERLSGARDVQLMTGISGTEFIFAHFVFDFVCHFIYCVAWCFIHYIFSFYSLGTAALLFSALLSFGPVAIGACYVMAEYSSASGSAVATVFLLFYIGGAIVTAASAFLAIFDTPVYTQELLYAVPPYALLSLLNKIWNNEDKSLQCQELHKEGIKLPQGIGPNCEEGLLEFSTDGVGFEFAFLLAEGLLFLAFMIFKTSGYLSAGDNSPGQEEAADEDVAEERKKVEAAIQKGDYVSNSMLVWRLHKHFGDLHAVRGICMTLQPSECFGLLGVNGAGKTTTFQMLAALISASYGDASTAVAKLSANARRVSWRF